MPVRPTASMREAPAADREVPVTRWPSSSSTGSRARPMTPVAPTRRTSTPAIVRPHPYQWRCWARRRADVLDGPGRQSGSVTIPDRGAAHDWRTDDRVDRRSARGPGTVPTASAAQHAVQPAVRIRVVDQRVPGARAVLAALRYDGGAPAAYQPAGVVGGRRDHPAGPGGARPAGPADASGTGCALRGPGRGVRLGGSAELHPPGVVAHPAGAVRVLATGRAPHRQPALRSWSRPAHRPLRRPEHRPTAAGPVR